MPHIISLCLRALVAELLLKNVKILIIFVKIRLSSGLFSPNYYHRIYVARLMPYVVDYQFSDGTEGKKFRKE